MKSIYYECPDCGNCTSRRIDIKKLKRYCWTCHKETMHNNIGEEMYI